MDAAAALERLREISSQIRAAVIFERGGKVVGSTIGDEQRAKDVAGEAEALLTEAERQRDAADGPGEFAQLEVALQAGSVFVVRARLLRPQELPARSRDPARPQEACGPEAEARDADKESRCGVVTSSPACCSAPARSPGRCSSGDAWPAGASGSTCTSATGRWSRWRS